MELPPELARAVRGALTFDTRTGSGARGLVSYVMDLLDYGEFQIMEQAAAFSDADHTNLLGRRGPPGPGGLLLSSAVLPSGRVDPTLWTDTEDDPLNATAKDGLLIGLGAAGNRLDLVCRIVAATQVAERRLTRPVLIAGLFGDDARVGGALHLVDSGVLAPHVALVSDATNLELVRAHRGYAVLRLTLPGAPLADPPAVGWTAWTLAVHGESAHTAAPGLGRNAVQRALDIAGQLAAAGAVVENLAGGETAEVVPDRAQLRVHVPPGATPAFRWALSRPASGDAPSGEPVDLRPALRVWRELQPRLNALLRWSAAWDDDDFLPAGPLHLVKRVATSADGLVVDLELRPRPGADGAVESVHALARELDGAVRRAAGGGASCSVEKNLLPFRAAPDSGGVQVARAALHDAGLPGVVGSHAGFTEAWVYDSVGFDTLVFGPGRLSERHRPNEAAVVAHLVAATRFYAALIERICCGRRAEGGA